jgi:CheY-like chemotaxis protein
VSAALERVSFLVVDDNVHMQSIVRTILKGFGAEVVYEAASAAEAMERLGKDVVDIVILDYMIGEEDGVAFLSRLRTSPDSPAPYVPVIMLTAHADRAHVSKARDAGVTEFCAKPVTPADMLRKITAVIERPRPFVRTGGYTGPDRRRGRDEPYAGKDRRRGSDGEGES